MICWPIDIYNWVQGNETIAQAVLLSALFLYVSYHYPAVVPASSGHSQFYRLAVLQSEIQNLDAAPFTGILLFWDICDNRVLLEHTPETLQAILRFCPVVHAPVHDYAKRRFYGSFYVALGAWSAKRNGICHLYRPLWEAFSF